MNMKQKNKTKKSSSKLVLILAVLAALVILLGVFWLTPKRDSPKSDRCTDRDWEINNCVPAGQCQPYGAAHETVDCFDQVKDYDSKYNIDL